MPVPLAELAFSHSRSSGAGGQNVNKTNTKVTLRWSVIDSPSLAEGVRARFLQRYANRINASGELLLVSQRFRDQARNRQDVLRKLEEMVAAVARAPRRRRPTRPTRSSVERRLTYKRRQGERKRHRRPPHED